MQSFAVFKEDKLAFSTNKDESAGVLWLFEKMVKKSTSFPVAKNEQLSVQIFENQTKPQLTIVDGKPTFQLNIKAAGVLFENEPNYRIEDPKTYRFIIRKMESQIKKEVEGILTHAHSQGIDVFGFGWYLFKYHHQEWNQQWKNDWRNTLPNLKVTVKVDADIQRSASAGIVEKE